VNGYRPPAEIGNVLCGCFYTCTTGAESKLDRREGINSTTGPYFSSCVRSRLALGFVGREGNCLYGDSSAVNTGAGLLAVLHKGTRRHHPHGCDLGRLHPGNKSCSRDLRRDWPHAVHHFVSCKQHAVLVRSCSDGPGQPSHGTSENDSQVSCHAHPLGIPTLTRAGLMGGRPATEGARCTARHAARVDCPLASGASDARVVCRFTDGLLVWRPLNKFGHSSPGSGHTYFSSCFVAAVIGGSNVPTYRVQGPDGQFVELSTRTARLFLSRQ
jgi:hypothetical protein